MKNGRIYPAFEGKIKDMMNEVPEAFLYFYDSWKTWHDDLRFNKDNSMIRHVNKQGWKAEEIGRMNRKLKLLAQRRKLRRHIICLA
ncbi:MAG: hypothetical protein QME12_07085 [Nanoarchaeota archaeon]|nr:hypothetical protein [Nanoarchaeota archaeon]